MKTFIQLKGGETISIFGILRFVETGNSIEIYLSDGSSRTLSDNAAQNRFLNNIKDQTIFTY